MIEFPEGRLFAYGTLMFDPVVEALIGRRLESAPATLHGYERLKVHRGEGGARGPVLFPTERPGSLVQGRLLEGADEFAQTMLTRFESAAGGYELIEVVVETSTKEQRPAAVYCAQDSVRAIARGLWDEAAFERDHLDEYLRTRIPTFLRGLK